MIDRGTTGTKRIMKKVILLGDGGVGKTALVKKFVFNAFDDKYIHTIGTKVSKKVVSYPEKNVELIFMIWDMEGQRRDPLLHRYFSGAEGALIVCDLTRFYTFEHLQSWAEELYSTVGRIPIIFIGNKSDLMEQIQYGSEELSSIAKKYKTKFYITSAKVGDNVENAFRELGIVMIS